MRDDYQFQTNPKCLKYYYESDSLVKNVFYFSSLVGYAYVEKKSNSLVIFCPRPR